MATKTGKCTHCGTDKVNSVASSGLSNARREKSGILATQKEAIQAAKGVDKRIYVERRASGDYALKGPSNSKAKAVAGSDLSERIFKSVRREPRPQMTSALARSRAVEGRPDAPPFDGVAFLRTLR